jgi:hypothetical protein
MFYSVKSDTSKGAGVGSSHSGSENAGKSSAKAGKSSTKAGKSSKKVMIENKVTGAKAVLGVASEIVVHENIQKNLLVGNIEFFDSDFFHTASTVIADVMEVIIETAILNFPYEHFERAVEFIARHDEAGPEHLGHLMRLAFFHKNPAILSVVTPIIKKVSEAGFEREFIFDDDMYETGRDFILDFHDFLAEDEKLGAEEIMKIKINSALNPADTVSAMRGPRESAGRPDEDEIERLSQVAAASRISAVADQEGAARTEVDNEGGNPATFNLFVKFTTSKASGQLFSELARNGFVAQSALLFREISRHEILFAALTGDVELVREILGSTSSDTRSVGGVRGNGPENCTAAGSDQGDGATGPDQGDGAAGPDRGDGATGPDQGDGATGPDRGDGATGPDRGDGATGPDRGDGATGPDQGDGVERTTFMREHAFSAFAAALDLKQVNVIHEFLKNKTFVSDNTHNDIIASVIVSELGLDDEFIAEIFNLLLSISTGAAEKSQLLDAVFVNAINRARPNLARTAIKSVTLNPRNLRAYLFIALRSTNMEFIALLDEHSLISHDLWTELVLESINLMLIECTEALIAVHKFTQREYDFFFDEVCVRIDECLKQDGVFENDKCGDGGKEDSNRGEGDWRFTLTKIRLALTSGWAAMIRADKD